MCPKPGIVGGPSMNCHPVADLIKEPFKKQPFPQFRAPGHPQAAAARVGRPGDPCPGPGDPPRGESATHPGAAPTHPGTEIPHAPLTLIRKCGVLHSRWY